LVLAAITDTVTGHKQEITMRVCDGCRKTGELTECKAAIASVDNSAVLADSVGDLCADCLMKAKECTTTMFTKRRRTRKAKAEGELCG
jgi:TPP-dependent indolepyruvate ferredoxin oxidoreductase alpha subunit